MALKDLKTIEDSEVSDKRIHQLRVRPNQRSIYGAPGLTGKELQAKYDEYAELLRQHFNELVAAIVESLKNDDGNGSKLAEEIMVVVDGFDTDNPRTANLKNAIKEMIGNEIATEAVTTEKIAREAVTTNKIAPEAVTHDKLGVGAVGNSKIAPEAVSKTKIKNGAVTLTKLADEVTAELNESKETAQRAEDTANAASEAVSEVLISKVISDNKFDGVFDESGYIDGNGNVESSIFKRTSKYFEIGEHNNLLHIALSETVEQFTCVIYDKNMNYLSTVTCSNTLYHSAQIYPQSAFFRSYTNSSFNGMVYISGTKPSEPVDFTHEIETFLNAEKLSPSDVFLVKTVSDNMFDGVFDESGYIGDNGNMESSMFKRTSKYYDLPGNEEYLHISLTEETGTFAVVLYDENKSYVGLCSCNNLTFASSAIPANAVYFRVYAYSSFNGEAYVSTINPDGEVNYEYKRNTFLNAEKLSPSIDKKLKPVEEQLKKLYNDVFLVKTVSDNMFDGVFDESGYIDGNGNVESSMFKRSSKYYEIGEHNNLLHIALSETVEQFTCVIYDKNMNYLSTVTCSNTLYHSAQIYPQSAFFRSYTNSSFNGMVYISGTEPSEPVDFTHEIETFLNAEKLSPSIDEKYNDVFLVKTVSDNMFDGVFDESGYIGSDGNMESSMFKRSSKYYEIGEHNNLLHIALSETVESFACVVYDKNMNYLSTATCNNTLYQSAQIYPESAFFRLYTYSSFNGMVYISGTEPSEPVDFTNETETFINADKIYPPLTTSFTNTLKDKVITCFGDSLAANCYVGSNKQWIEHVGEYFKCKKIYNRGVGGSAVSLVNNSGTARNSYTSVDDEGYAYLRISYPTSSRPEGIPEDYTEINACMEGDERINTIPLDTDILLIEAGTNDNDLEVEALSSAYDRMLVKIQNRLPDAKIVILGLPFTNPSIYMNDEMRIAFRNKLASLMVGIREVAKNYGIPVIELRDTAQVNLINYTNYMSEDGLHYDTANGTKRWAEAVINGIKGLTFLD